MAKVDLNYLANLAQISNHINTCLMARPLGLLPNKGDTNLMDNIRTNVDKAFLKHLLESANDKEAFEVIDAPTSGVMIFAQDGSVKVRGPHSTVTTLVAADRPEITVAQQNKTVYIPKKNKRKPISRKNKKAIDLKEIDPQVVDVTASS